jgi:D-3-phosphoglycerate dehydrogenase
MKKVLVATEKPFAKVAVDGIKKVLDNAGYEMILLEKYKDPSDFVKAAANVDAVIIRSDIASKEVIEAGKNIRIIVRAGAGYDNIDLKAATENNVVAMNTPGQNSNAVAELAFGMMTYIARNKFDGSSGYELRDKKIGIHAFGYVGKYVALIAKGFGMDVYAYDPFVSKDDIEKNGVKAVSTVEEHYAGRSYIGKHCKKRSN